VVVCQLAALQVQLFADLGNRWTNSLPMYHWLMPISCHFWHCKALLVTSLACYKQCHIKYFSPLPVKEWCLACSSFHFCCADVVVGCTLDTRRRGLQTAWCCSWWIRTNLSTGISELLLCRRGCNDLYHQLLYFI